MNHLIQYLKDHTGKRIGVYLPIEIWEALLKGNPEIFEKFRGDKRKKSTPCQELPSFDLGGDYMPTREEIYDEHILNKMRNDI
jgi:hypothetical protein